jgi:hypothetical protein
MMPIPFPVGAGPPPRFIPIPRPLARRIRRTFLLVGIMSTVLGPLLGLVAMIWGAHMLVTRHALITTGATIIAFSGLLAAVNGTILLMGRRHVSADHMNISSGWYSRRMLLVFWITSILIVAWGSFFVAVVAGKPKYPPVSGIAASPTSYLLVALAIVLINTVDFFVGHWLFQRVPRRAAAHYQPPQPPAQYPPPFR